MRPYGNHLKTHNKRFKIAAFAALVIVMFMAFITLSSASNSPDPAETDGREGEWDVFGTDEAGSTKEADIDATAEEDAQATAGADADATGVVEITPTPDPDATPVPTYNGDKILFEPGGGSGNGSTAGSVIMIIIVVLAILSIVSGIVEKIVKYYKNRDKEFKVD